MNNKLLSIRAALLGLCLSLTTLPMLTFSQQTKSQNDSAKGVAQSELKKENLTAEANDLPSIKTTDLKNGAVFRVYFDEVSAAIAETSIPTLAAYYRELADLSRVDAGKVNWHSIVFTQKSDYVQPRREGDVRWTVLTNDKGQLTDHGIVDFYLVIPHEQSHAIQKSLVPQFMARWFKEGQATWLGLKVTERWNPEVARKEREVLAAEQKKATEPLALRKWGSVRVSGGAIMRQMTPEEREKMKQNPNSVTSGSFTFSGSDIISDESNAKARYGAAFDIFEEIEKKSSPEKVNDWLKNVWEQKSELGTDVLIKLTLEKTGVDITEKLK